MNFMDLQLTPFPGETAENDVLTALTNAVDLDNQSLFAENGVKKGVDTEIVERYYTNPKQETFPIVMLQTWQAQERSAQGGGRINTDYVMSLYFLYYFGIPNITNAPIEFVQQRRRHLTACMKAIEMQTGGNQAAQILPSGWKWDSSRNTFFDFLTPFQTFGNSIVIPPKSGVNCVRVDRPISVWHKM